MRPVFIWGPPGIGKSAIVEQFANELGMECVSLLGSQLAPEDIIGVPQIADGTSRFCPPRNIARREPYVLFLDELNACSQDVQKAFYSLIHEKRIGEYSLPHGSVVIGAGNRSQDSAIVRQMSSALINRMVHVQLSVSPSEWLEWARQAEIHPLVYEFIQNRPDFLWTKPPKTEETFSTPRAWHMLSDALKSYGETIGDQAMTVLVHGCVSARHAQSFMGFIKQVRNKFGVDAIIKGKENWPSEPENRDVLYFLALSFRSRLFKDLPVDAPRSSEAREFAHQAKALLTQLSRISFELAQIVIAEDEDGRSLPGWFLTEIVRDLPRLAKG